MLTNLDLNKYAQSPSNILAIEQEIMDHERDLEQSISNMTHAKNDEVLSQIDQSTRIMAAEEERIHKFKYTKTIDCKEMMRSFNLECLTLNY